jgi:elongation factor P
MWAGKSASVDNRSPGLKPGPKPAAPVKLSVFRRIAYALTEEFTLFMIAATQLRPGMVVKFNNELHTVFSMVHRTPGNLRGFVQAKMRNIRSGSMIEHRFSSEDKVERITLDEQEMEYLYDDGDSYYFMNTENYEQIHLTKDNLGDGVMYLIPQLKVSVEFYEGRPISVELPPSIEMTVKETEPGLKGATVSNVTKPAKMDTGLVVMVPPFINEGEKIRVSTSDGSYLERA